jgi:hypothetical protein
MDNNNEAAVPLVAHTDLDDLYEITAAICELVEDRVLDILKSKYDNWFVPPDRSTIIADVLEIIKSFASEIVELQVITS